MTTTLSGADIALERALTYTDGSHTAADIAAGVADGTFQRWDMERSVIVTEVREVPGYKYLLFFLAGGNMAELRALVPVILEWGKRQGCARAQLVGREAWTRTWLTREGWTHRACVLELTLEGGI